MRHHVSCIKGKLFLCEEHRHMYEFSFVRLVSGFRIPFLFGSTQKVLLRKPTVSFHLVLKFDHKKMTYFFETGYGPTSGSLSYYVLFPVFRIPLSVCGFITATWPSSTLRWNYERTKDENVMLMANGKWQGNTKICESKTPSSTELSVQTRSLSFIVCCVTHVTKVSPMKLIHRQQCLLWMSTQNWNCCRITYLWLWTGISNQSQMCWTFCRPNGTCIVQTITMSDYSVEKKKNWFSIAFIHRMAYTWVK